MGEGCQDGMKHVHFTARLCAVRARTSSARQGSCSNSCLLVSLLVCFKCPHRAPTCCLFLLTQSISSFLSISTMCHVFGSIEQAISTCPMCKVFPHANRCPHTLEVCRNRTNHPRHDVLYLKNAEVDLFNGCGFCKWARLNPGTPQKPIYNNPGWPGCCRPPSASEQRLIQAADWRSVSKIHQIPIPADVKAVLDNFSPKASRIKPPPSLDRKHSNSPPSRASPTLPKSAAIAVPGKPRSGGSPKQGSASLSSSLSRSTGSSTLGEQRRLEGTHSPNRRNLDLDTPRKQPAKSVTPTASPASKVVNGNGRSDARRLSIPPTTPKAPTSKIAEQILASRPASRDDDEVSTTSGSSGSGSLSDNTVTSDGGFTDYLSDESEAELQRQAEAKAALVAQNAREEMEFRAARLKLTDVDLSPPTSWNATNPEGE